MIACDECGGSGEIEDDCSACSGEGQDAASEPCEACEGSGSEYYDCEECGGTGEAEEDE